MTYDKLSEDQKKVVEAFIQLSEEERDDVYWYLSLGSARRAYVMKFGNIQITSDMQLRIIYLAAPYTSSDPSLESWRFEKVTLVAGMLLKEGYGVFSPITHGRPIAEVTKDLPTSAAFWETLNKWMMRACDEVWVLTLPGWQDSDGVSGEIDEAVDTSTPVHYITMDKGSWPS